MTRRDAQIVKTSDIDQVLFDITNSPVVQAPDWMVLEAYDWQKAIWMACWQPGAQVSVITCNGSGKSSFTIPVLALSWASAFPGSMVVITSASERQLKKQLIPGFTDMIQGQPEWSMTGETIRAPKRDGLQSEILCFVTNNPDSFEGFHNQTRIDDKGNARFCPLLMIYDEGKSIKNAIYDAGGRCDPAVELRISSAGEDTGGFYDSRMNVDGLWTTGYEWNGRYIDFEIPWTMCPHLLSNKLSYDRSIALLRERGERDPYVASRLLAKFYRSGDHILFDESDLLAIQDCMGGMIPHFPGQRVAFCDLSGGGDELTFGLREGNRIHPLVAWTCDSHTPPSVKAARYIKLFQMHHLKPEDIMADNGGLGKEIINEMDKAGWRVKRINFGKGAIDSERFVTRIAELHWEFKMLCHQKAIILPNDPKFYEQARKRRYTMKNDNSGCINLEDKQKARRERQEHSPDRLETVVGLLIGHEEFATSSQWKNENYGKPSQCGTIEEFWKAQQQQESGDSFGGGWGGAN